MEFSICIDADTEKRRVDEVLCAVLGMSARQIKRIKAEHGFYLDGKPVYANALTQSGQILTAVCDGARDQGLVLQDGPYPVVYEDDDLQVVCKPAPLAVTPTPEKPLNTLANYAAFRAGASPFVFRPVNRLDKGTSGLMVVAKHALAQKKLIEQLHTDVFCRQYLAVCQGWGEEERGCVDLPIGRAEGDPVRRCVREDGKRSITNFSVLTRSVQTNHVLLLLQLETGRTHQIRVHMAHSGHPVIGDALYGAPDPTLPGRIALHSARLSLWQPFLGKKLEFSAPLPPEIQALL